MIFNRNLKILGLEDGAYSLTIWIIMNILKLKFFRADLRTAGHNFKTTKHKNN